MSIFIALGIIAVFAYFALNSGERVKPGWMPALTVVFVCLLGYLLWPLIGPIATWFVGPILASYGK